MARRQNFQTIAWFWDIYQRELLVLDPPYQRRSVWNRAYQDYFIDTLLLQYPAPAIFLFEEIDENGSARYNVVDGKQRLTTIFDFIRNYFPVAEIAQISELRGKYFKDLDKATKTQFWSYEFSVEYLPTDDESIINNVFDRINKNVAKLTPQELRHARFDGVFITVAETLTDWMSTQLPQNFPRITLTSRSQMKDVELTAQLLLLIEEGPKGYSQIDLDKAFSDRDLEWNDHTEVEGKFRTIVGLLGSLLNSPEGAPLTRLRIRNQTDFYALFGALDQVLRENNLPPLEEVARRLIVFLEIVDDDNLRDSNASAAKYYAATRTASNLTAPRTERVEVMKSIILGDGQIQKSNDNTGSDSETA